MRSPKLLASGSVAINMTPMIDVVFLLIIFFLVSSHMAKQENQIKLELPQAASALQDVADRESLTVNILADGQWHVAGVAVDDRSLPQRLRQRVMAADQSLQLKIRTDRNVPYARIEPVLKMAGEAGIGDIVFAVYDSAQQGTGER